MRHARLKPDYMDTYAAYYKGKRTLEPDTAHCQAVARRLRDVSCFIGDLEQYFTTWFNRTRPCRRRLPDLLQAVAAHQPLKPV